MQPSFEIVSKVAIPLKHLKHNITIKVVISTIVVN